MALVIYQKLNSQIARTSIHNSIVKYWIECFFSNLRNKNSDLYFSNQTWFDLKSILNINRHCTIEKACFLRYRVGFIFEKKNFFHDTEKFGKFYEKGIIYLNLLFIYKNPIILTPLKIVTLKITMYIFTILAYFSKIVRNFLDFLSFAFC